MLFDILRSIFRKAHSANAHREVHGASRDRPFVAFVTAVEQPHFLAEGENLESDQASMRLRVGLPARELARKLSVCLVPVDYVNQDPALARLGKARAIVLGKLPVRFFTQDLSRATALVKWVERAASRGRIVVDFSDDLGAAAVIYSQPALLEFQKRLLRACPATVPTHALRERLAPDSRHDITVIEDPYESAHPGTPRFSPGSVLRLVWFGVFSPELRPFIEAQLGMIARRLSRPLELAFVTYSAQAALVGDMAGVLRKINPQFAVRHVAWSLQAAAGELERADMVVLPQDAGSDWGRVKSHNRLVESIRAGRFAVVSPIPAYVELADYAWVGEDLGTGIEWALAHPTDVLDRIVAGQMYVGERFAPSHIAAKWARVLEV